MSEDLDRLIEAAAEHGNTSEPEHQVGDLDHVLRLCWEQLTPQQSSSRSLLVEIPRIGATLWIPKVDCHDPRERER